MARERVVRVYQEDWWPFRNLPAALRRFSERTGIATELAWDKVGVGTIETMFDHMVRSFTDDEPPFDLVCTDEVMLRRFAAEGRVLPLNRLMERDGIRLDDVTPATREAVTLGGEVLGPALRQRLEHAALPARPARAPRAAGAAGLGRAGAGRDGAPGRGAAGRATADFHGFATRGAGGGGHSVWTIGTFLASFGGRWIDRDGRATAQTPAAEAALEAYRGLLAAGGAARPALDQLRRAAARLPRRPGRDDPRGRDGVRPPAAGRPGPRRPLRRRPRARRPGGPVREPLQPALVDPAELAGPGRGVGAGEVPDLARAAARGRARGRGDRDRAAAGALRPRLRRATSAPTC